MTEQDFQQFVTRVDWTFARSIPNWPHFYLVEEELHNPQGYASARAFIREHGYDGHFFDLVVRYYDLAGWTYWSSPLAKAFDEQYMINRCRTEYTWGALAKAGELPAEGFEGQILSLTPVLDDPEFQALMQREARMGIGNQSRIVHRHRKLFHALPYLMDEHSIQKQCSSAEFEWLEAILEAHQDGENSLDPT